MSSASPSILTTTVDGMMNGTRTPIMMMDTEVSNLTDRQEIVLSLSQIISASLSFMGSIAIMTKVVRNRAHARAYDRIMLGLSLCDATMSIGFIMGPFLLPAATSHRVWAIGNDTTCTLLGFFTQFSFSAMFYNAMLSYYYLLTVRCGVKRSTFARRYETPIHVFTWIFFLSSALLGVGIDLYGEFEINLGCWVGDYPTDDCDIMGTCTGRYYGWVLGGIPTLFTFLSLIVNNVIIYCHVRKLLGRSLMLTMASTEEEQHPTTTASDMTKTMQIRETASQNFLYVFTFVLCYVPAFVVRVVESSGLNANEEASIFGLLVVVSILTPLQGFFNLFVYAKPAYSRVRKGYPEGGRFWAMKTACFSNEIPTLNEASRRSTKLSKRLAASGSASTRNNHNKTNGGGPSTPQNSRGRSTPQNSRGSMRLSQFSSNLSPLKEASDEDAHDESTSRPCASDLPNNEDDTLSSPSSSSPLKSSSRSAKYNNSIWAQMEPNSSFSNHDGSASSGPPPPTASSDRRTKGGHKKEKKKKSRKKSSKKERTKKHRHHHQDDTMLRADANKNKVTTADSDDEDKRQREEAVTVFRDATSQLRCASLQMDGSLRSYGD